MAIEVKQQQLEALLQEYLKREQEILNDLSKEDRQILGHPIKNVSKLDSFMANGNNYVIRTSLTISRFENFETLQVKVGFGVESREIFANMKKAYGYLNDNKLADASVVLYNSMNGIKEHLDERENEVLLLCSLFICLEDEDVTTFDLQKSRKKIEDWKKEGISMESFFTLAFGFTNSYTPVYNETSLNISDHVEKIEKELSELKDQPLPKNM